MPKASIKHKERRSLVRRSVTRAIVSAMHQRQTGLSASRDEQQRARGDSNSMNVKQGENFQRSDSGCPTCGVRLP